MKYLSGLSWAPNYFLQTPHFHALVEAAATCKAQDSSEDRDEALTKNGWFWFFGHLYLTQKLSIDGREHPSWSVNSRINFISEFSAFTNRHTRVLEGRNLLHYFPINANRLFFLFPDTSIHLAWKCLFAKFRNGH